MEKILGNYLTQGNRDFPLDCETLDYLQGLTALAGVVGNIGGDRVVLWGCETNGEGTSRGAGYVFVRTRGVPEGEILPWEGGPTGGGMYVKQEAVAVNANNTNYPKAYTRRSLAPGIGEENYRWEDFTEIRTIKELMAENRELRAELAGLEPSPLGVVQMWAGAEVPGGYVLCNGQELRATDYPELYKALGGTFNTAMSASGTRYSTREGFFRVPDLRGRFVVGLHDSDGDYGRAGTAGGLKRVTLTEEEVPAHSHGEALYGPGNGDWRAGGRDSSPNMTVNFGALDYSQRTGVYGGGGSHENRPPYYVLAYIMRAE